MTTARRPRRARAVATILATALALGACGGDDDPDDDSTATTPPPTTEATPTTAAPSPEDEVEAAYLAYWDMAARLSAEPNPDDPEIRQRAVEPALGTMVDTLSTLRAQGQSLTIRDGSSHDLAEIVVDGETAVLRDCSVDDSAIVDAASGGVVEERVVTSLLEATLELSDGVWRLRELDVLDSWDGPTECTQ